MNDETTVAGYLATRLAQLGIRHFFGVPGDYNLVLLDELIAHENLTYIGCCNELNAGYAADGYARAAGIGVVVTTFSVGALSAINAIAGAFAEDLPIVFVSGGPNSNSAVEHELLHHTIGGVDYDYQRRQFVPVTAMQVVIDSIREAPSMIDDALEACLREHKPVYIEIAANVAGKATTQPQNHQFGMAPTSNPDALSAAVSSASSMLNAAVRPVLVAGAGLRAWDQRDAFVRLADAMGCAVATMPDAKGFFPEDHPGYVGIYWGSVSSPGVAEVVESADAYLFTAPVFTDYSTAGHSALVNRDKLIEVRRDSIVLPGAVFDDVVLSDFLDSLATSVQTNATSLDIFSRTFVAVGPEPTVDPEAPLTTRYLSNKVAGILDSKTTLVVDTGDSWFNAMKMRLPEGCHFEIQMKYGSIGWSVGATLGYQIGCDASQSATQGESRRVITLVGDGSFQMTAQEVSTMIRHSLPVILFVINNGGYTIEVEIHDGPYNKLQNWRYSGLVDVFNAGGGSGRGWCCTTARELDAAVNEALLFEGVSLIEAVIDRDDCSRELLEWGSRVVANNGRPPHEMERL